MAKTDYQKAIRGSSIARRRNELKAHQTRIENLKRLNNAMCAFGAALSAYDSFQTETYGGLVERVVLRTPLRAELGEPSEIPFHQAQFECSGWAEVGGADKTDFSGFEGKQLRYLLTLDRMFMYPSLKGAVAEVLDAGCSLKTKKAIYTLAARTVKPVENLK